MTDSYLQRQDSLLMTYLLTKEGAMVLMIMTIKMEAKDQVEEELIIINSLSRHNNNTYLLTNMEISNKVIRIYQSIY
jgi:hypothetical protein